MIHRLDSGKMEDTDSKWLRATVYNALIRHVDAVRIFHCTWPNSTSDWRRYVLAMAFRLAMARSGWSLNRDIH